MLIHLHRGGRTVTVDAAPRIGGGANAGICHLGKGGAGQPAACGNSRAHMTFSKERFAELLNEAKCVNCAERERKWAAMKAARQNDARMFPSYTISELRKWLTDPSVPEATKAKAQAEIQARKSGVSQTKVTPQAEWGGGGMRPTNKIGRL